MKREQLTNVETEAQCQELADYAMRLASSTLTCEYPFIKAHNQRALCILANRIISLRSQQVTP